MSIFNLYIFRFCEFCCFLNFCFVSCRCLVIYKILGLHKNDNFDVALNIRRWISILIHVLNIYKPELSWLRCNDSQIWYPNLKNCRRSFFHNYLHTHENNVESNFKYIDIKTIYFSSFNLLIFLFIFYSMLFIVILKNSNFKIFRQSFVKMLPKGSLIAIGYW